MSTSHFSKLLIGFAFFLLLGLALPVTEADDKNVVSLTQMAKRITFISCQGLTSTNEKAKKNYQECRASNSKHKLKEAIDNCEKYLSEDFKEKHKNATVNEIRNWLCDHVSSEISDDIHKCIGEYVGNNAEGNIDAGTVLDYILVTTTGCYVCEFGKAPEMFPLDKPL